jgi:hypothetical protein
VKSHSYFEGEADQNFQFKDALTEEELWVWIRTQPDRLPQGTLELLPSFEFIRLKHKPLQLYQAEAVLEQNDTLHTYSLTYAELQRKLSISFTKEAPHTILDWTEEDLKNPNQITRAQIKKTVKLPYWKLNKLGDDQFRDSLGLN